MKRPPTRTRLPRNVSKLKTDHWSHEDEDLLRAGVWRYAEPPHTLAERRRLSVAEFWATITQKFGDTMPNAFYEGGDHD